MPPKTIVTQENKLISHSSQVEKSRKWQRSLTVTPLPASSSSNDGDSDWDETKRKQLKTAETVKDHNGLKKSVEVEKGKVLNAPKRHMSAYMLCSMLLERRSSLPILASVSWIFPRRHTRSGRGCPRRRKRSGIARLRIPEENIWKAMKEYKVRQSESSKKDKSKKKK